jgi:hypothetical protein
MGEILNPGPEHDDRAREVLGEAAELLMVDGVRRIMSEILNPGPEHDDRAREVLGEAAELLMVDGWAQGSFHADDGRHCAIGAIAAIAGQLDQFDTSRRIECRAVNLLRVTIQDNNIVAWNDDPHRTAEDVILALKRAANAGS